MITITNPINKDTSEGINSAELVVNTTNQVNMMVYVETEEIELIVIPFVKEKFTGQFFPIQYFEGGALINSAFSITDTGKYRLAIPVTHNEDELKIEIRALNTIGNTIVTVVPDSPSY